MITAGYFRTLTPYPAMMTLALLPAMILGCAGQQGANVEVTGKVTYNDHPVGAGVIWFSADKSGAGFSSDLQADGSYKLTLLGVAPGDTFQIYFSGREPREGEPAKLDGAGLPIPIRPDIPSKYFDAQQSGLTAKIEQIESQTLNFNLTK